MSRVLAFALLGIAAIVASTLVLDWFVAEIGSNRFGISQLRIDLREARACTGSGICGSVPMSAVEGGGMYVFLSQAAFYLSFAFALVVLYQAGIQATSGVVNASITKAGHGLGVLVFLAAVGAAYVFNPELGSHSGMGMTMDADRSWGPAVMLLGLVLANLALYYTRDADFPDEPVVQATMPVAIARTKTAEPKAPVVPPVRARTSTATTPP